MAMESQTFFSAENRVAPLGIVPLAGARELSEKEIDIIVKLNEGECSAVAWGCDLTYDYVKINGDYRT